MAKTENDRAIEQMRQRLASAQAVLDMRDGGSIPPNLLESSIAVQAWSERANPPQLPEETIPALEPQQQRELSQTELFSAKMARENARLPGAGPVPIPAREESVQAANAQQTVSLPTATVKPPELPAEELYRRKLGLENLGIPTAPLADALAYHQANYRPPELPEMMPIPVPEGQGNGWEVQRGLTAEEQGEPDADQRQASVSGGAGSLFGNVGRLTQQAAEHTFSRFWSHPGNFLTGGGRGSFHGGGGEQWSDPSDSDSLKKAIETLTKSVDNLAKIMEQREKADHTQHGHSTGMPGKPSVDPSKSPTKADKKSGVDPALIRQGAAVIARAISRMI